MSLGLPSLPKTEMFIGGIMSMEWQEFFRLLFERVGGYEDLPDNELLTVDEEYKVTFTWDGTAVGVWIDGVFVKNI
jgi:hypothetical protein